jgi:linoleoyl-CoA desaturase
MLVSPLFVVAIGVALFTSIAQSHMVLHRPGQRQPLARLLVGACLLVIGASPTRWIEQHNRLHHPYLNRSGLDPDLDFQPALRLHAAQPWRRWHRYQAWYCWLLYPFTLLGMTLGSFRIVFSGATRDGRAFDRLHRRRVLLNIVFGPPVMIAACIVFVGVGPGLLDWAGVYLVAGTLLGVTFQINHCSLLPAEMPEWRLEGGLSPHDRLLRGTLDVRPTSAVLAFFTGSLSRHSAHHLNPSRHQAWIAHKTVSLGATDPAYRQVPSITAGVRAHFRYMRLLGLPSTVAPTALATVTVSAVA